MAKPEDIVTRGRHEAQVYADEGVPGACNMITELCDTITELRERVEHLEGWAKVTAGQPLPKENDSREVLAHGLTVAIEDARAALYPKETP